MKFFCFDQDFGFLLQPHKSKNAAIDPRYSSHPRSYLAGIRGIHGFIAKIFRIARKYSLEEFCGSSLPQAAYARSTQTCETLGAIDCIRIFGDS
jgi:hypothetical protein